MTQNTLELFGKRPRVIRCQARDCDVDCANSKPYCQRKHLCEKHMQAAVVHVAGTPGAHRFCFQCGRLELLDCFDGKKRTCRMGLARRRSSPSHPSHKRRLSSSSTDADTGSAGAADLDADMMPLPTPEQQLEMALLDELQRTTSSMSASLTAPCSTASEMANSHMSHGPSQGSPVSSAANTGAACYSSAQYAWKSRVDASLASTGRHLGHSSPSDGCCPAAMPGNLCTPSLAPQGRCPGVWGDEASQLQLMLESELTAAALSAAIASSASAPLDPHSRKVSQQLAAALLQDSSLLDCTDLDLELGSMFGPPAAAFQGLSPVAFKPLYSSCADSSSLASSQAAGLHTQRTAAAAAAPAAVAPGVPVYSAAGGCKPCAPFAVQQVVAPGYSSTAGPVGLMPCISAGMPAAAGMPVSLMCPQHMLVPEVAAFSVPCSAALPAEFVLGAAEVAIDGTYPARLQELQQQMSVLNAHLTTLKMQLGMFST